MDLNNNICQFVEIIKKYAIFNINWYLLLIMTAFIALVDLMLRDDNGLKVVNEIQLSKIIMLTGCGNNQIAVVATKYKQSTNSLKH